MSPEESRLISTIAQLYCRVMETKFYVKSIFLKFGSFLASTKWKLENKLWLI